MALTINFDQEKMFVQGDFDMNSVHRYNDSLKEAFKQTMLNQEVIFRKQVHDLHRLYSVQITLMKELGCKEFDRYDLWKAGTESSLMPHTNPITCESLLKEPKFSAIQMVGLTPPISQEMLEERQDMHYKFQQKPLDLQVPANQYIQHDDKDFLDKHNVSDHLENTLERRFSNASDAMNLTLSLSIGVDSRRIEGSKRPWIDKKTCSCPKVVIDLEDTTEKISSGAVKQVPSLGSTGVISYFGGKHESLVCKLSNSIIPRSVKKGIYHKIALSSSLINDGECYQGRHSSNKEFKESQDDISCMSIKKQQKLNSYDERHLDLNKVEFDELSPYSDDLAVAYPSTTSSSGGLPEMVGGDVGRCCPTTTRRKEINNCSSENSDVLQHDNTVSLAIMSSPENNRRSENWHSSSKISGTNETEASPVDVMSISRLPMDLGEYHGSCCGDPKNNRDRSTSVLGDILNELNHTFVTTSQVSCEKSEVEDTVYSCSGQSQDKRGNKCAASCKSCCNVDIVVNSRKTMQSGIGSGNSNVPVNDQFSGIHVPSQVEEILSGKQDQRSSSNDEHISTNKKEESVEVDVLIQRAAESLIHISLETSACLQDFSTRSGSNEIENEESEQPQSSSDSYELIALKLTESGSDDYCVTSKPFELNGTDTRDFGIKLRRGRRMKDFQKEILPGLASLSSHEICEDINILEGVLRSKEYRKNRARMADGESWCSPLRSRRTRFNHSWRKILL